MAHWIFEQVEKNRFVFESDSKVACCPTIEIREGLSAAPNNIDEHSLTNAKTVSPREHVILEIISPFAFTFKIPFH